jgi:hypothetical protein
VPTRAETDHRATREALRILPSPSTKRTPRVYLFRLAGRLVELALVPGRLQALGQTPCKNRQNAQHLRPNTPPSTRMRRFPLDIRKENAIACLTTFIQNTNATVARSVQRPPGDVRKARSTAVGEEMQTAAPEATPVSTTTTSVGNHAGAGAPSVENVHPYGLCTPRGFCVPATTCRRTFSRVHLSRIAASGETAQTRARLRPRSMASPNSPGAAHELDRPATTKESK